MFRIICSLRDRSKTLDFEAHKCPLVGFIFELFHPLRSPSYRKLIEQLAAGRSGLPHERIEQRHSSIFPLEKL